MGILAAYLRDEGHEVSLCLLERGAVDNPKKLLQDFPTYPVIIAKPNFKDFNELLPLLRGMKATGATKRTFLCGPFASMNASEMMQDNPWLDGIIYGYPEETAADILASLDEQSARDTSISGGIWRDASGVHDRGKRLTTVSMDELPFSARDIEREEDVAYVNIEASRGCLFNCSFCHVPIFHGQNEGPRRLVRNPQSVADEIEQLKTLGKTLFIFNDPMFWTGPTDTARVKALCEELIRRKLDAHFYVYLRCNPFPPQDLLDIMVEAGLVRVFLGVENASTDSLVMFKKMITPSMAQRAWDALQNAGVNVHLGFIVFEPYASLNDIEMNVTYLGSIGKLCRIGVLIEPPRVVPGSGMRELLARDGMLLESSYDTLLYAYNWRDEDTRRLFSATRQFFMQEVPESYGIEYHCVSGKLLQTLVNRTAPGVPIDTCPFDESYDRTNQLIAEILGEGLRLARTGASQDEIFAAMRQHANDLRKHAGYLGAVWGAFVDEVRRKCGSRPIREIFTGKEGIS